jgi:hypothetical protein
MIKIAKKEKTPSLAERIQAVLRALNISEAIEKKAKDKNKKKEGPKTFLDDSEGYTSVGRGDASGTNSVEANPGAIPAQFNKSKSVFGTASRMLKEGKSDAEVTKVLSDAGWKPESIKKYLAAHHKHFGGKRVEKTGADHPYSGWRAIAGTSHSHGNLIHRHESGGERHTHSYHAGEEVRHGHKFGKYGRRAHSHPLLSPGERHTHKVAWWSKKSVAEKCDEFGNRDLAYPTMEERVDHDVRRRLVAFLFGNKGDEASKASREYKTPHAHGKMIHTHTNGDRAHTHLKGRISGYKRVFASAGGLQRRLGLSAKQRSGIGQTLSMHSQGSDAGVPNENPGKKKKRKGGNAVSTGSEMNDGVGLSVPY